MSRRVVLGVLITGLMLAAALAPWTVSSRPIVDAIARQLEPYGLRVTASGRTAIALLPVPRVKVDHVSVSGRDASPVLRDVQLRGELDVASLLTGTLALDELTVRGGRAIVPVDRGAHALWQSLTAGVADSSRPRRPLRRLTLTGTTVDLDLDGDGGRGSLDATLDRLEFFALRSSAGGLAGSASFGWRGQRVDATFEAADLDRLLAGQRQKVDVALRSAAGSLTLSGQAALGDRLAFDGPVAFGAGSMSRLLDWLLPGSAPRDFDRALAVSGTASVRDRDVGWPQVQLALGTDRFEGALSAHVDADEPTLRATLATGVADLGWLAGALREPLIGWVTGTRPAPLPPAAIVDLRLSASDATVGRVRLRDAAASVLVEGGRLDLSLLRATAAGGTVKGRLSTALDEKRSDLKGQLSLDRVDVAEALRELSLPATLTGIAQGQAAFEAPAGESGDLRGRLAGRISANLRDGEILGIDTADAARRLGAGGGGAVAMASGRTPVARADLQMIVQEGIARVTGGTVETGTGAASLGGQVSLLDGALDITATAAPGAADPASSRFVVQLEGAWNAARATGRLQASPVQGPPAQAPAAQAPAVQAPAAMGDLP